MTNEELITLIKSGVDVADNMAQLWQQNRGFIGQIARRYSGFDEEEDLIQEGYIGLCKAVDGYDPDRGGAFLTYAAYWIKQAMLRYIQNNGTVRIPVNRQGDVRRYQHFASEFRKHHGRKPDTIEMAGILGIPYKEAEALEKMAIWSYIASTDAPIGDDGVTLGELVLGSSGIEDDILDGMDRMALCGILWPMVDELPDYQPAVIRARFQGLKTLKETAGMLHQTTSKVHDIELKAIKELRRSDRIRQLRPYAEEYISTHAYRGCGVGTFNRTWSSSTERTAIELVD